VNELDYANFHIADHTPWSPWLTDDLRQIQSESTENQNVIV